jgi:hypothetical protein
VPDSPQRLDYGQAKAAAERFGQNTGVIAGSLNPAQPVHWDGDEGFR